MIQFGSYPINFTNMPAGAEYMDFYQTCYTARIIEEGPAFQFHLTAQYTADQLRLLYNGSKPLVTSPQPSTLNLQITKTHLMWWCSKSNVFLIQA